MQTASAALLADRPDKPSLKVKLGFGIGDLGGNLIFTMIGFNLVLFLTDSFGLSAGLAGTAFLIGKLWDAVTDPAVGYLSDRTRTRWGRRRPYMAVGAILVFIFLVLTFSSPQITTQPGKFAWVLVIYCLLNTAYTLVNIPYSSLTPELTGNFQEQTVLNGYRMSFAVVGTITGAVVTNILVSKFTGTFGSTSLGWMATAAAMGAVAAASTFVTVLTVKEQLGAPITEKTRVFKSYMEAIGLKPLLLVVIPYALHMTGVLIIMSSLKFYFRYVYGDESQVTIAMGVLLVMALLLIPIWVKIAQAIGKKKVYNVGMGIVIVVVLVFFALGTRLPIWFSFVVFAVAGIGLATNYVMPYSLMPDVVEYDFGEHGTRREGVLYGIFLFFSKLGQALGGAITGWVLALVGYIEPANESALVAQSDLTVLGIRLLNGPIPVVFFVAGIIVLSFYPITREVYEEIMVRVKEREETG